MFVARELSIMVVAAVLITMWPASAAGQHHHGTHESPALPAHAGLALEAGSVEILGSKHGYQGIAIMGGARWRRFELALHIPYYRIEVGPVWISGFGDPHIEGRYLAFTRRDLQLGGSLAVMAPLGNDDNALGMGHWMFMASGLARIERGRFDASVAAGYGGGFSGGGHVPHAGGAWPPVAPMTASQLEAATRIRVALGPRLGLSTALSGAIPLGQGGVLARVSAALNVAIESVDIELEVSHGLLSHPQAVSVAAQVSVDF